MQPCRSRHGISQNIDERLLELQVVPDEVFVQRSDQAAQVKKSIDSNGFIVYNRNEICERRLNQ